MDRRLPRQLRRRQHRLGQSLKVWNGEALMSRELPTHYSDSVHASAVGYFDLAEPMVALEEEAVRLANGLRLRKPRVRHSYDCEFPTASRGLGGTTTLVINNGEGVPCGCRISDRDA